MAENARKHGLNVPLRRTLEGYEEVAELAKLLTGPDPDRELSAIAERVAEAQLDLFRVRRVRNKVLARCLGEGGRFVGAVPQDREGIEAVPLKGAEGPGAQSRSASSIDVAKGVAALGAMLHELEILDRYERRALSRRRAACEEWNAPKRSLQLTALLDPNRSPHKSP